MTIDAAQHAYLATYKGLSDLICTRLYPDTLPEEPTLPAVVYQRASTGRDQIQIGAVAGGKVRLQYTVFATTRVGARAVADQLVAALDGYKGTMGGAGGLAVTVLEIANERDQHDQDTDEYQTMLDAVLAY